MNKQSRYDSSVQMPPSQSECNQPRAPWGGGKLPRQFGIRYTRGGQAAHLAYLVVSNMSKRVHTATRLPSLCYLISNVSCGGS